MAGILNSKYITPINVASGGGERTAKVSREKNVETNTPRGPGRHRNTFRERVPGKRSRGLFAQEAAGLLRALLDVPVRVPYTHLHNGIAKGCRPALMAQP